MYYGAEEYKQGALRAANPSVGERAYVGQYEAPAPPEHFVNADLLLDHILCQDDYAGDWAEDTLSPTEEQEEQLTHMLRLAFVLWMEEHGLRPTFGLVLDPRCFERQPDLSFKEVEPKSKIVPSAAPGTDKQ